MDWDQIESKWVAMTRRVCGELAPNKVDAMTNTPRFMAKADGADRQAVEATDQQTAMTAQ